MSGLLLPSAVEVVGHDVDEVQVAREGRDVVGPVDRVSSGGDGGGEDERWGDLGEGRFQLLEEGAKEVEVEKRVWRW